MNTIFQRLGVTIFCIGATASVFGAELTGALKKIHDTGEINIGYRESSVPFSYLDDQQRPIGYSLDLCKSVVETIKTELNMPRLNVKMTPVTSATRIPLIANGTIDMECGSTVNNAERQLQVNFSVTTFTVGTKFIAKKAAKLSTLEDLRGKSVAVTSGTNTMARVHALNQKYNLGLTILPGKDHAESMLLMDTGRAAAFFEDDILLAGLAATARNPGDYALSTEAYSVDPYAIMLGRNDPVFKQVIDKSLIASFKSGEVMRLYDKWFQKPIPPKNVTLNFPLSPAFKKIVANPTDSPDPAAYAVAETSNKK